VLAGLPTTSGTAIARKQSPTHGRGVAQRGARSALRPKVRREQAKLTPRFMRQWEE
jgi:hypothetical protein